MDKETQRRLALAKIYSLLLELAEQAEKKSFEQNNPSAEEKIDEPKIEA